MGGGRCVNGTLDDSSYSSPIPAIGLYVAVATLVSLFLMIFDIITGFHIKKRWLPCRFFSLNSITLTLLAIATKLPVDLTTTMPSAQDQLSKLTGTILICISMGFLMPSLGIVSDSECFSNMVALSILVVTIIVNICLQMSTGVIFVFHIEHTLILCTMMVLLTRLWFSTLEIKSHKEVSTDHNKGIIIKGRNSMLQRLKLCYLKAYNFNPQFVQSKHPNTAIVGVFCLFCLFILVQALFRLLFLNDFENCGASSSDYAWSMWFIVVTQSATIIIGSLGTIFRSVTLVSYMQFSKNYEEVSKIIMDNPFLRNKLKDCFPITLKNIMESLMEIFAKVMYTISFLIIKIIETCLPCCTIHMPEGRDDQIITEFQELIHEGEMGLEAWTLRKGAHHMMRCIEAFKRGPPSFLKDLLSKKPPSDQLDSLANKLKERFDSNDEGYKISSLSVVLLVRIASISLLDLSKSFINTLSEVFEIIHFVDKTMNSSSLRNRNKCKLVKFVWKAKDFDSAVLDIIEKSTNGALQSLSGLKRAIWIITRLKSSLPSDLLWKELGIIADFIINSKAYETIENLHEYMEQLYIDMVNEFLTQLPNAIFKDIIESHPEDFEEKLRFGLKLLCKIESAESYIQWSFPIGSNIRDLISSNAPSVENNVDVILSLPAVQSNIGVDESSAPVEDNVEVVVSLPAENTNESSAPCTSGSNIRDLISSNAPSVQNENSTPVEDNVDVILSLPAVQSNIGVDESSAPVEDNVEVVVSLTAENTNESSAPCTSSEEIAEGQ